MPTCLYVTPSLSDTKVLSSHAPGWLVRRYPDDKSRREQMIVKQGPPTMIAEVAEVLAPGAGECGKFTMSRAVLVLDKTVVKAKLQGGEPDNTVFIELTRAPFDCEMRKVLFDEEGPDVKRAKLAAARLSSAAVKHLLK